MHSTMHRGAIPAYHAHVYYKTGTKHLAAKLRNEFIAYAKREVEFGILDPADIRIGQMHDQPIGPHTEPQFMVSFTRYAFHSLVNHLILSHGSLSVLIHPETGNDLKDHTEYAMWLGDRLELDLSKL